MVSMRVPVPIPCLVDRTAKQEDDECGVEGFTAVLPRLGARTFKQG